MYAHGHKEAKKVHRFLKETAGAKHNNLKWWQRTEYNYVSHVDTAKIWQKHLFLKQNEHGSPGYRNFLNGLPASSSCMCCNIETLKSKKEAELHLISLVIINDVNMLPKQVKFTSKYSHVVVFVY